MPANPRVRSNNVFGLTTDNPLTAGATSFNSAGLVNLPVIATQHAIITLDPLRQFGEPEIVVVTAHTGAATVATISRAAYGTVARSHPQNTLWVHAPVTEDYTLIVTSSTRPSDPYRGQMIFEYDTDKYVGRSILDAWEDVVALGAWQTWSPTLTNLTLGSGSILARYSKVGRQVEFWFRFTLGAGSAVGTNPQFTLPVAAHASYVADADVYGDVNFRDTGTANYRGQAWPVNTTTARVVYFPSGGAAANVTAIAPHTWASTDTLTVAGSYEAAA